MFFRNPFTMRHFSILLCLFLSLLSRSRADENLDGYRSIQDAVRAQVQTPKPAADGLTGYLGVALGTGADGAVIVEEVGVGSPASIAGIVKGDTLTDIAGVAVKSPDAARTLLQSKPPGEELKLPSAAGRK